MYRTIYVPSIETFETYTEFRGIYLSMNGNLATVGDTIFFITDMDVKAYGVVTEIETPTQSKIPNLTHRARFKYHWSEGTISMALSKFAFGIPRRLIKAKAVFDLEDRERVLEHSWTYNKTQNRLETRIDGKAVNLARFILRQNQRVHQRIKGLDFRKVNLTVGQTNAKTSSDCG